MLSTPWLVCHPLPISGGLAAALSLNRHCGDALNIECYEARGSIQEAPGGQYSISLGNKAKWSEIFGPAGMNVEEFIDQVKKPITMVKYIRGGDGSVVWARESGPASQYIPQVRRRDLLSIMLKGLPEGFIQWNKMLQNWSFVKGSDGKERIQLDFADGHRTIADYVVAADGNNSSFRQRYFPKALPLVSDITSIYAIAKIPPNATDKLSNEIREMVRVGQSTTSLAKDSVAGIFPLPDDELCIFAEVRGWSFVSGLDHLAPKPFLTLLNRSALHHEPHFLSFKRRLVHLQLPAIQANRRNGPRTTTPSRHPALHRRTPLDAALCPGFRMGGCVVSDMEAQGYRADRDV
jgi:2-polyprenyl-6-methoxyphenol hydroxylase-like FAD-dependent oxidoreductase